MIDPDNPDQLLDLMINQIGNTDQTSKDHFKKCPQCRSILFGSLKIALENMMKDPILGRGFYLAAKHVKDIGHGFK